MEKKKIITLSILIVFIGILYYFVQKGRNVSKEEEENTIIPSFELPKTQVPEPGEADKGKFINESTTAEEAKYYVNHPAQNPFLNPIIMPGFIIERLLKRRKKK